MSAAGALAATLGLLAGTLLPGEGSGEDARPFEHYHHVPRSWLDPEQRETARDCRGCHDEREPATIGVLALCSACHLVTPANASTFRGTLVRPGAGGFVAAPDATHRFASRSGGGAFHHGDHAELACRACHAPDPFLAELESGANRFPGGVAFPAKARMPVRAGLAECRRCHGEAEPRIRALDRRTDRDLAPGDIHGSLNARFAAEPVRTGHFQHADHLAHPAAAAASTRGEACIACHAPLAEDEDVGFADAPFTERGCGECHRGQEGSIAFGLEATVGPSTTALTFRHRDHLGRGEGGADVATPAAAAALASGTCSACHAFAGNAEGDFVHPGGGLDHAGCVSCHDLPAWRTRGHADWDGDWARCTDCHRFGSSDLRTDRPTVSVRRHSGAVFRVETQRHPQITGTTEVGSDADCGACHVAPLRELPSRIREARFSHATHLAQAATAADCAPCHGPGIAAATSPLELGWPTQDGARLPYDPAACAECHLGSPPVASNARESPAARSVVAFPHALHLARPTPEAPLDCLTCHPLGAEQAAAVGTLPAAASCELCHDHGESDPVLGQLVGEEVKSCASCHRSGVPARGAPGDVLRHRVTEVRGAQLHPPGTECGTCHWGAAGAFGPTAAAVVALGTGNAPRAGGTGGILDDAFRSRDVHRGGWPVDAGGAALDCLACHWSGRQRGMSADPEDPAARDRLGETLADYPGVGGAR